jgi:O-antigen/teichoic acid export membrane protein
MTKATTSDRKLAISGAFWTVGGYGTAQALRLISNLVLAKLLAPEAFGIMALVAVVIQGVLMTSDIGLTASIVQSKRGEDERFLRTAWTLQVIRGFVLAAIVCALATPVSAIYATTDAEAALLRQVLLVISITAVLAGFCSTSIAIFRRRLQVASTVTVELLPQIFSITVMIVFACFEATVWALVAGWLAFSSGKMVVSHLIFRERRDRFGWDVDCFRELFGFGQWIFASTALSFLAANLDKLVLGKLLSLAELGLYSIALTFAKVAIDVASRMSGTVVFPLLARHRENPEKMVRLCLRGRQTVLMVSGALGASFCLVAPLFFEFCYDEAYHGAGWVAQYLCFYVWCWTLVASVDRIPLAMGHPRLLFSANVVTTFGTTVAVIGYFLAGLPGFIIGMGGAQLGGLAYVVAKLPCGKRACWLQSTKYSVSLIAYVFLALSLMRLVRDLEIGPRALVAGLLTLPVLVMAAIQADREVGLARRLLAFMGRDEKPTVGVLKPSAGKTD